MGSELFTSVMWIAQNENPDWQAAREKAAEIRWGKEGDGLPDEFRETTMFADLREAELSARETGAAHDPDFHLQETLEAKITMVEKAVEGSDRTMVAIDRYGWRVFITATIDDNETVLGQAIEDLNRIDVISAAGFNPRSEKVNVLVRNTRHATEVYAHHTEAQSRRHLAERCREDWGDHIGRPGFPDTPPDDDEDAIDLFYQQEDGLSWAEITEVDVDESPLNPPS